VSRAYPATSHKTTLLLPPVPDAGVRLVHRTTHSEPRLFRQDASSGSTEPTWPCILRTKSIETLFVVTSAKGGRHLGHSERTGGVNRRCFDSAAFSAVVVTPTFQTLQEDTSAVSTGVSSAVAPTARVIGAGCAMTLSKTSTPSRTIFEDQALYVDIGIAK
jgi:hypothetical protein